MTLVEILVVAALVSGILAGFYFFFLSMKGTDENLGREQEFAQLLAQLTLAVREDLRTATDLSPDGEGRWILRRLVPGEGGVEPETVTWSFSPERNRVTREGRFRKDFDFAKLVPPGKRIRFELK